MFDLFQFGDISKARLEEWAIRDGDVVCVRIEGTSHEVRIAAQRWQEILERHRHSVDKSKRRIWWAMGLQMPFAILMMFVIHAIPPLDAAIEWVDENLNFLSVFIILAIWSGLPLGALIAHARTVLRATEKARAELAGFPHYPARRRLPPRASLPTEKLAILTVVPYLLIQTYGTFNPDAYRNTPWTGTQFDLVSVIAVAILAAVGFRRWRAVQLALAEQGAAKTRRDVDVLARVRETTPPPGP